MEQKFKFNHNMADKKIEVIVQGLFNAHDGMNYVNEYSRIVKRIDASDYDLNFDCTKLSVTAANVVEMLEDCFKMYKEDGFKMVRFRIPEKNSATLKMQFNRLARSVGLNNYEFIA